MAKAASKTPNATAPPVTFRVLLLVVLVAVVAAGVVAGWAEWRIRSGDGATAGDLEAAARAQADLDEQRAEELALAATGLGQRPDLPLGGEDDEAAGPDATPDPGAPVEPAARRLLEDVLDDRQLELVVVLDASGQVVARAGGPEEVVGALAASDLVAQALADTRARGAWTFGGRLYQVAAERVERDSEVVGAVVVADLVGRSAAMRASRLSRADAVYLVPGEGDGVTAVATTLGREAGTDLVAELEAAGALVPVLGTGERAGPLTLDLGATPYRATVAPIRSADGQVAAARVTLTAGGDGGGLLRMVQAAAVAGLLAALLLGVVAAPVVSRGAGAPSKEVVAAAEAARSGDLAGAARHAVPAPLAEFFHEASEKRALEAVVAALAREGATTADDPGTERRRGAVLVVEMPRFARSGPDAEPREVAERLGRDLTVVRRAVGSRGGRVEAALGHRALAVFDGERAAARGLGAAAEILGALSEPENAFDDPVPPALGLATGTVIVGGTEGGRTVTGLPVQQAESLLREAASGDLLLSKTVHRELEGELAAGGVEVARQRGLLTPQPVYVLDAGRAARAAAAVGTTGGAAAPGLAVLAPGLVLADRFTLTERRSTGPAWTVFSAADRGTDSRVAVKVLRRDLVVDPEALDAFDAGVRGVLRVVHPAVVRVVELGVSDGLPFVATETADGPTLARVLASGRALAAPAALRVARWLAAALEAVHGAGFAHGAVRPEGIILDPRGQARLADLGVALLLPPPGIEPIVDRALGSARYLAPERLAGGEPTAAADVYAAGALLAELFTGRPLYGSAPGEASDETGDRLRERIAAGPPEPLDPTELPDGLAPVLTRCLERDPAARYADGGALGEALVGVRAGLMAG